MQWPRGYRRDHTKRANLDELSLRGKYYSIFIDNVSEERQASPMECGIYIKIILFLYILSIAFMWAPNLIQVTPRMIESQILVGFLYARYLVIGVF